MFRILPVKQPNFASPSKRTLEPFFRILIGESSRGFSRGRWAWSGPHLHPFPFVMWKDSMRISLTCCGCIVKTPLLFHPLYLEDPASFSPPLSASFDFTIAAPRPHMDKGRGVLELVEKNRDHRSCGRSDESEKCFVPGRDERTILRVLSEPGHRLSMSAASPPRPCLLSFHLSSYLFWQVQWLLGLVHPLPPWLMRSPNRCDGPWR